MAVVAGQEGAFEAGVAKAASLFLRAKGCHGVSLHRVVETPNIYRLLVKWETVENHMIDFRNSADFREWRRLVGSYFDGSPTVTHSSPVAVF
ncbi:MULTISPECIES: antibiotic biosynthesis monooxygenase family protein [Sinorhizobium]|uniref:antibiotic biosynthesis monooxygenase family protein n=1 Tax=Sinorhizobium TaxID=28105 RepID=UPI000BEA4CBF|nr:MULTISPECIES: antibiotic biosynthesis monooxygenase family protein [Sinorhizobium]PDT55131.1 antibiotic biosynthesis monooxygenase [Sinorhizobium sp. NG07B]POH32172.1 antibiotic biosynthesis monooxygenase [Sinorhizobium americanum]